MKTLIHLILISLLSSYSFSQISINWEEDFSRTYNGDTVYAYSTENAVGTDLFVVNNGPEATFIWRRVRLSVSGQGFTDELCDNMICHLPSGSDWTCQLPYTIPSGDSTLFQPKLITNNQGGSAHFRYYILDDNEEKLDSVDVKFESTLNIAENDLSSVKLKVYPNPSLGNVYIETQNASDKNTIIVMDALGKTVYSKNLYNQNSVSLSDLRKGVYFAKIHDINQGTLVTQKFVVH
jgi:hypothetical protein